VPQFCPHPVELADFGIREDQPTQVIVLAVKQRERDDFIHRDDARVTERDREELAEVFEPLFEAPAGRAALTHDDRQPGHGRGDRGCRLLRENLSLHTPFVRFFQPCRDDELGPLRK
jgi:hypothetical protein